MIFRFSKSKRHTQEAKEEELPSLPKKKWIGRLNESLKRTRHRFSDGLGNLILGKKQSMLPF